MNALYCALDRGEFNRVSGCNSAQEIWKLLEVTHEGTSVVKDSKISMIFHDYELFKMKPQETIKDMFTRFTDITNALKALGKTYSNMEQVAKIFRCLPKSWEPRTFAIKESKDLKKLPLEELLGILMTYEMECNRREEEEQAEPKRTMALKASKKKEVAKEPSSSESSDDEVTFLVRILKKAFQRNDSRKGKFSQGTKFKFNKEK